MGPFCNERIFNDEIIDLYVATVGDDRQKPYIQGLLESHKHKTLFAHGKLKPENIIIRDGHLAGIVN